jgi:hypothetical protein
MIDLDAARRFMATHARMLDRRRFGVVFDGEPADGALAALAAYRNPDGGYGWGLEPDLRDTSSQPAPALHAFEVFEDIAPATSPRAAELCDWLQEQATLPDGGLPFALPVNDAAGCAPFWANADPTKSSLQITAIVATKAHRVAVHDPAVKNHPWLARATEYCLEAIDEMPEEPHALALSFAIGLLDEIGDEERIDRLARHIPENGLVHVGGGLEDEFMRPLDFAPFPDRPARALFSPDAIEQELDRLAAAQSADDGGWSVDYASYSPAAELEWRGYITVRNLTILRANGRAAPRA